jgi:glycopeptide antibiotics resistance protein
MHDAAATPIRSDGATTRSVLLTIALIYTVFVFYGCLVPLDFVSVPWNIAWARYRPVVQLAVGDFHRGDFTANVLLFIPLAFFWAGVMGAGWRRVGPAARSLAVFAASVGFQAGLEFLQIYTPRRTISLWDILAGGAGAIVGLAAWWLFGARVRSAIERWRAVHGGGGVADWFLLPYSVFLLLWNLLPLDLTLDPGTLHRKWWRGSILPIPFSRLSSDPVAAVSGLTGEALLWLPVAGLLVLSGRTGRFVAWCATLLAAVGVEAIQLLINSRVSDSTDIVCAAAGGGAGVWIGHYLRGRVGDTSAPRSDAARTRLAWGIAIGVVLWSAVLTLGYLYPFDFDFHGPRLGERFSGLLSVPFRAHWQGAEELAASDVLIQLLLFAPFGAAAALVAMGRRGRGAVPASGAAGVLFAGLVGFLIEAAQAFLPAGKVSDSTDVLLGMVGATAGFAGARAIDKAVRGPAGPAVRVPARPLVHVLAEPAERATAERPDAQEDAGDEAPPAGHSSARTAGRVALAYAGLLAIGLFLAFAPGIPYNVRELFERGGFLAVLGFPAAVMTVFAPPILLARWSSRGGWGRALALPGVLALQGALIWAMLRAAVPRESILDVVGSSVWNMPKNLEQLVRFVALFTPIAMIYAGGALLAIALTGHQPDRERLALRRWALAAIPILAAGHFVIVVAASTDNLTELMAGGGTLVSSLVLGTMLAGLAAATTATARAFRRRVSVGVAMLFVAGGLILGGFGMAFGTERQISKYRRTFSAPQFLLSADRDHYAGTSELIVRFTLAYGLLVAAGAIAQAPFAGSRRRWRKVAKAGAGGRREGAPRGSG